MTTGPIDFDQVQANILLPYAPEQFNCARLMCFRFDPGRVAEARAWVREVGRRVTWHSDVRDPAGQPVATRGRLHLNVGFTWSGLEALGFDPFVTTALPRDFREGMRKRAERLGDGPNGEADEDRVHALVILYGWDALVQQRALHLGEDVHAWRPLSPERIGGVEAAVGQALHQPAELLPLCEAVTHLRQLDQDSYRLCTSEHPEIEYFGFRDGISQPRIKGVPGTEWPGRFEDRFGDSEPSTVLIGHRHFVDTEARPATRLELAEERLRHGSFLAVRKLSQDVPGFHRQVCERAEQLGLERSELAEKMVGRRRDGRPLVGDPLHPDDFDYDGDAQGEQCPFQSHLRRSNPRDGSEKIRRIMRRGMPYSSRAGGNGKVETGLMFLAYNADLEAQFEFVQRLWVNSGVENHALSRDRDPIAGEPAPDDPEAGRSSFSFTSNGRSHTLTGLESHVRFRWGDYFLVPSRSTLEELSRPPGSPIGEYERLVEGLPGRERARDVLGRWLDDRETSKRIWREVRERGGVVRLAKPGAVLVGTAKRAKQVLRDDGSRYSVRIQGQRMEETTGAFYLGMDAHTARYRHESAASAPVVPGWRYDPEHPIAEQLEAVRAATKDLCAGFLGVSLSEAVAKNEAGGEPRRGTIELGKLAAFVLSGLTPKCFGVPQPSAQGTFELNVPASGYTFFPFPPEGFREYADAASQAIRAYLLRLFEEREREIDGTLFPEGVHQVDGRPARPEPSPGDPDESWRQKLDQVLGRIEEEAGGDWGVDDHVRNMAGIISGMLIASFKLFVDGLSSRARSVPLGQPIVVPEEARARLPFDELRRNEASMPNVLYRQSLIDQELGGVGVREGDFVLVCQGSAMADAAKRGRHEEWFYGDRTPPDAGARKTAPHYCPGHRMADVMLGTMSGFLLGLPDLRRVDDTGERLDYDWAAASRSLIPQEPRASEARGA